jgi:hypothetical protein
MNTRMRLVALAALALVIACNKKGDGDKTAGSASVSGASTPTTTGTTPPVATTGGTPAKKEESGGTAGSFTTAQFPATEAGAKALLEQFLKPGADHAALSKNLKPTTADYKALFDAESASKLDAAMTPEWDKGRMVLKPNAGQTELKLSSATTDDFKSGSAKAKEFPGGYKKVAPHLNAGVTLYRFKFVEPGKDSGMAFDGLAHVNGHWVIVPKPWRSLGGGAGE